MKQTSMTEEQLTDALRALKPDTSEERFLQLTSEAARHHTLWPLLWYAAAASVTILFIIASIWSSSLNIRHESEPTTTIAVIDDNLSQLVNQSIAAQAQAQQQRTMTNDIVSEHISLVEP